MSLWTYGDQEIAAIKRVLRKNGWKKIVFVFFMAAAVNLESRKLNCLHNSQNMEENNVDLIESSDIQAI